MNNRNKSALLPKLRFPGFKSAGPWKTEKLGSVATISTQKVGNNVCVPMSITSGVGLVSQEEKFGRVIAGDSYKNYLLLKPNEFAYNKSATKEYPEGFLTLYSGTELAAVPNSIFTCFRINGESPDVRFLNYQFSDNLHGRWLRKFIQVGARAHGSLSINDSDLMALPVPTPTGTTAVAEQQKIADCLSSLDELIAAQARKVDALKIHKKGLMQQLFPREGETQPRLRFPEFRDAGGWIKVPLGRLGHFFRGLTYSADDVVSEGLLVLRSSNIQGGQLTLDSDLVFVKKMCPPELRLKRGDIAICMSNGSKALVGKSGELYEDHQGELTVGAFCSIFRPTTLFAKIAFQTPRYENFVATEIAGGNINNLKNSDLEAFEFQVPPNVKEQQKIAALLSSLDDLITAATQELKTLKIHKKGLMQQLFPSLEAFEA